MFFCVGLKRLLTAETPVQYIILRMRRCDFSAAGASSVCRRTEQRWSGYFSCPPAIGFMQIDRKITNRVRGASNRLVRRCAFAWVAFFRAIWQLPAARVKLLRNNPREILEKIQVKCFSNFTLKRLLESRVCGFPRKNGPISMSGRERLGKKCKICPSFPMFSRRWQVNKRAGRGIGAWARLPTQIAPRSPIVAI